MILGVMMKKKKDFIDIDNPMKDLSLLENDQEFCINFFIKQLLYYKEVYHVVKKTRPFHLFKNKYQEWEELVKELEQNIAETENKLLKYTNDFDK